MRYDPATIRAFFNGYGEREWQRFDRSAEGQVNLHVHRHYLAQFIEHGMHVLDAGAGPGRFTIELARLGARITVLDLSEEMLEQNARRIAEAGLASAVVERVRGDITALEDFGDERFDAVVCYGGPLSYVADRADDALSELLRVAKPDSPLLLSVMSTVGSARSVLPAVLGLASSAGIAAVSEIFETGNLSPPLLRNGHYLKMYRWEELNELLLRHSCRLELASASNYLTVGRSEQIDELLPEGVEASDLLAWETFCCRQPGALDGGTHTIVIVRKT